jgi:hypothetical protein
MATGNGEWKREEIEKRGKKFLKANVCKSNGRERS